MAVLPYATQFAHTIWSGGGATIAYPNPINAGDALVVILYGHSTSGTPTVTDTAGHTYTLEATVNMHNTFGDCPIWVYFAVASTPSSTNSVTATIPGGWLSVFLSAFYSNDGGNIIFDSWGTNAGGGVALTTVNYGVHITLALRLNEQCSLSDDPDISGGGSPWTLDDYMNPGVASPGFSFSAFQWAYLWDGGAVGAGGLHSWSILPGHCTQWIGIVFALAETAPPITASCSGLGPGITGTKYTGNYISFNGGTGPYCVLPVSPDINPLPPGLMFDVTPTTVIGFTTDGKPIFAINFFGVPTKPGTYTFTLNITDLGHTPLPTFICVTCSITVTGTDLSCPCGPVEAIDLIVDFCYAQPDGGEPDGVIQYGFPAVCNVWFGCLFGASLNDDVANGFTNAVGCGYLGLGCTTLSRGANACCGVGGVGGWQGEADCDLLTWYNASTSPVYHDLKLLLTSLVVGMTNAGSLFWDVPLDLRTNCTCDYLSVGAMYVIVRFNSGGLFILFPTQISEDPGSNGGRTPGTSSDASDPVSGAGGVKAATSGITFSVDGTFGWTFTASCSHYNTNCPAPISQWARQCHKNGPTVPASVWFGGFPGAAAKPCPSDCTVDVSCLSASCLGAAIAYREKPYIGGVVAVGGLGPFTYALTSGQIPPGLTFSPSTGSITGSPTKSGAYQYEVTVSDHSTSPATTFVQRCGIVVPPGNRHY